MAKELIPVPSTLSGTRPKGDGRLLAKVNVLREIQSAGGEELGALLPSPCGEVAAAAGRVIGRVGCAAAVRAG